MEYVQGTHLVHHGYLYAGQLYVTNIPISPLGVPATFYFRLLATKVPLVVLGATVAGLIEVVRRQRERGFVLLRVWLVFVLIPYSLMAAKFMRYALPLFAAINLVAAVGFVAGVGASAVKPEMLKRSAQGGSLLPIAHAVCGQEEHPDEVQPREP